ncbi:MAG TPA: hypothetical protein VJM08_14720, partial [Anaerolineales bacterium]|nr:hypothetical protein [Anaerolineales bacterium]
SILWDMERREIHALIQSDIVVDNLTAGVINGRITDGDGMVIRIYGKESVVMASFGYVDSIESKWRIVTKPSDGYFTFQVPEKYSDADYVKLWVNSNSFSIRPGENSSGNAESYRDQGNEIRVNDDGIFVVNGAPPLSFIDLSSDEGLALQHFSVYQGGIDAKVTSARGIHSFDG